MQDKNVLVKIIKSIDKNMKKYKQRAVPSKGKTTSETSVVKEEAGLLAWLVARFPKKSRSLLKAVLRDGQVEVDGKVITQFDHALRPGQQVEVWWEKRKVQQQPQGLDIIHEDDQLIIVNKPSGLLTIATDKEKRKTAYAILSDYVKQAHSENKIFIIHRLDRETSGLLMFAKNEKTKKKIQESWATTISQRTYVGVVEGEVTREEGTIISWLQESKAFTVYSSQNPKHGQKSITHYTRLKANKDMSLLKINLSTGRKHQIRVHMQEINHPIIGDKKYGSKFSPIKRMGLHAQVLAFTHPETGKACHFETEIPRKFLHLFSDRKKK